MEIKLHFVSGQKRRRRNEKKDQHVNITTPIISYFVTVNFFFLTTPTAL